MVSTITDYPPKAPLAPSQESTPRMRGTDHDAYPTLPREELANLTGQVAKVKPSSESRSDSIRINDNLKQHGEHVDGPHNAPVTDPTDSAYSSQSQDKLKLAAREIVEDGERAQPYWIGSRLCSPSPSDGGDSVLGYYSAPNSTSMRIAPSAQEASADKAKEDSHNGEELSVERETKLPTAPPEQLSEHSSPELGPKPWWRSRNYKRPVYPSQPRRHPTASLFSWDPNTPEEVLVTRRDIIEESKLRRQQQYMHGLDGYGLPLQQTHDANSVQQRLVYAGEMRTLFFFDNETARYVQMEADFSAYTQFLHSQQVRAEGMHGSGSEQQGRAGCSNTPQGSGHDHDSQVHRGSRSGRGQDTVAGGPEDQTRLVQDLYAVQEPPSTGYCVQRPASDARRPTNAQDVIVEGCSVSGHARSQPQSGIAEGLAFRHEGLPAGSQGGNEVLSSRREEQLPAGQKAEGKRSFWKRKGSSVQLDEPTTPQSKRSWRFWTWRRKADRKKLSKSSLKRDATG